MGTVRLKIDVELSEKESEAFRRLLRQFRVRRPGLTENQAAVVLLRSILQRLGDDHNCIVGIVSIRKD